MPIQHADQYHELRTQVLDLVRGHDETALEIVAPAAPEWRVRDLLAHLSGVCADVVNGNLDGVTTDAWTAAQVAPRRDWPVDRLLDEWEQEGIKVEGIIRNIPDLPDWNTFLFDAATHEQDIRGALGAPGRRDTDPVVSLVDNVVERIGQGLDDGTAGSIRFELDSTVRVAGNGEPTTSLRTSYFEVFRAVTGRRSVPQMRAYDWDPEPRPEHLVLAIFEPRATDLFE